MPLTDMAALYGVTAGYKDVRTVDVSAADFSPPNGACHIYASGAGDIVYRAQDGAVDATFTIASGGGLIRLGDSLPIMIAVVRTAGTTATGIQAGLL